ncbi:Thiol:disulfide interchange protein CycY [Candidatus Magnetaquicoccaceae bacterium FCR-1]|uniref:Thiol:disulfide interchange protein CycY n=1 Tax=Candidatus Magnetaquiglobus chichijimensis TaxID=3141448 RepID=A0ABQ0CBQ1_9PROT
MNGIWKLVLLGAVMAILLLFALGLKNDPRDIPSPLVNRPASDFSAPALEGNQTVSLSEHRGKWVLVNFWGSWCISCVAEHPYLMELAAKVKGRPDFVMIGVDFRDTPEAAQAFLKRHGNPGYAHAQDPAQKIAIDWGVYGAPESYLVDPNGTIRMKHTGPLFPGWFEQRALPLMQGNAP